MVLRVPFDQFAPTLRRRLGDSAEAYLWRHGAMVLASAGEPKSGLVIVSLARQSFDEAKAVLAKAGIGVFEGSLLDGSGDPLGAESEEAHVVAVAYRSGENVPGLWVDAFPEPPTHAIALRALYDDFRSSGEVGDVSFEEFVRLSDPNVVIVGPAEIQSYLREKLVTPGETESA